MKVIARAEDPPTDLLVNDNKYQSNINVTSGYAEFILDINGVIVDCNLEDVNITGYEQYEIIGKSIDIFYPETEKLGAAEDLSKAARLDQVVVTGTKLKKRNVSFWAKMEIKVIYDDQKITQGYNVTLQDAAHRALSTKHDYLAVFDNPFVGAFKFRISDSKITMWNHRASEIVGIQNKQEINFEDIFIWPKQYEQFYAQLTQERRVEAFKFQINHHDGKLNRWGLVHAHYLDSIGVVEGVVIDISDQHQQMLELQKLNEELDNFTYHASHDLRSPLTTIMGLTHLAKKETSIDSMGMYLQMIEDKIVRMDVLLKDLISVTYNNKSEMNMSEFYFEQEIRPIIDEFKGQDHPVRVILKTSQNRTFLTDGIRMKTILRNLISNSFKYYDTNQANSFLKIDVRVSSSHVAIQLIDNGIGIEWVCKDRVWEMFYRATTRSTGTGLGLYIVKSMVEKLKGSISLESTINSGTTFLLIIPNSDQSNLD